MSVNRQITSQIKNGGTEVQRRVLRQVGEIDKIQAQRLSRLRGNTRLMAVEGIIRHLRACRRLQMPPCAAAVREIIDDALEGRCVYAITGDDFQKAA